MIGKYTLLLLGLLAMSTLVLSQSKPAVEESELTGSLIDIDTELGKDKEEVPEESGSGKDSDDEDEDDLDKSSGSGSGAYNTDNDDVKVITTTVRTLTPCQNLYESSKHLFGNFVPKCDENGDYAAMQCRGHSSTGTCWCADRRGADIPGTYIRGPTELDCESGKNLSPCLFELVKAIRNPAFGVYRPRCKISGEFHPRQCLGSGCFCVDENGNKISGTQHSIENNNNKCEVMPTEPVLIIPDKGITVNAQENEKSSPTKPVDPVYTFPSKTPNVNVEPPQTDDEDEEETDASPNETGDDGDGDEIKKEGKLQGAHIMTQPGLLAAIIGGAVVGLLCAILLVMFIVYRMRKKDEGSYALDEPRKKSTYSPINQSDKEYYA